MKYRKQTQHIRRYRSGRWTYVNRGIRYRDYVFAVRKEPLMKQIDKKSLGLGRGLLTTEYGKGTGDVYFKTHENAIEFSRWLNDMGWIGEVSIKNDFDQSTEQYGIYKYNVKFKIPNYRIKDMGDF